MSAGLFRYRFLTFLFIQYRVQTDQLFKLRKTGSWYFSGGGFQYSLVTCPFTLLYVYSSFTAVHCCVVNLVCLGGGGWGVTETRSRQMVASHPPVTHNPCNEAGHCEHSKAVVCARGYCPPPPSRDSWHPRSSLGVTDNLTLTLRVNRTATF